MPTAPDKTWSELLTLLADNSTGAITEADIRSIVRFARPSFAMAADSGAAIPTFTTSTTGPDYVTLPLSSASTFSENYLQVDKSGSDIGIKYMGSDNSDNVTANRLVQFNWNVSVWATSSEPLAMTWHFVPATDHTNGGASVTWPSNTTKRIRMDRMFIQNGWTGSVDQMSSLIPRDSNVNGYEYQSTGTEIAVMSPGDRLVPVLETYSVEVAGFLSYNISASALGTVAATPANIESAVSAAVRSFTSLDVNHPTYDSGNDTSRNTTNITT